MSGVCWVCFCRVSVQEYRTVRCCTSCNGCLYTRFVLLWLLLVVYDTLYDLTQQAVILFCGGSRIDWRVFGSISFGCLSGF